jgi:ABC-2 type transport system permease protein
MSLKLLLKDELNGFYRSKVMLVLWVGLPIIVTIIYFASPSTGDMPMSVLAAILVGSLGGLLSAAMLVASIINERERRVYDMFLVRPVKRSSIVLSKFIAVYLCIVIAGILSMLVGLGVDALRTGAMTSAVVSGSVNGSMLAVSIMAIACSAGILIGIAAPSMLVGVILVLYGANQLSAVVALPALFYPDMPWLQLVLGVAITLILLALAVRIFNRRQF